MTCNEGVILLSPCIKRQTGNDHCFDRFDFVLAISIGFKFQSAVVALSIALTVILVQLLSNLHERLTHLEQQFSQQKRHFILFICKER